jgi:hypothetical protein
VEWSNDVGAADWIVERLLPFGSTCWLPSPPPQSRAALASGTGTGGPSPPDPEWRSRAWCVASEFDFCSTYVGGSPVLIERVLEDERLEAIPVRPEDRGIRD